MKKDDIFIWVFLTVFSIPVLAFIIYHIRRFIIIRRESNEEKRIRAAKELEKHKKRQESAERVNRIFGGIISLIGYSIMLGAVIIFLYQVFAWLKLGQWVEIPFSTILSKIGISISDVSQFQWKGVAKIFMWIYRQSSVFVMMILGFVVTIFGSYVRNYRE